MLNLLLEYSRRERKSIQDTAIIPAVNYFGIIERIKERINASYKCKYQWHTSSGKKGIF